MDFVHKHFLHSWTPPLRYSGFGCFSSLKTLLEVEVKTRKRVFYGRPRVSWVPVTRWPSEQFRGKKSYMESPGSAAGAEEDQSGCCLWTGRLFLLKTKDNTNPVLFSFIVKAEEKLKEHSYKKDGRDKKEDESLERWDRYIVRPSRLTKVLFDTALWYFRIETSPQDIILQIWRYIIMQFTKYCLDPKKYCWGVIETFFIAGCIPGTPSSRSLRTRPRSPMQLQIRLTATSGLKVWQDAVLITFTKLRTKDRSTRHAPFLFTKNTN